MAPEKQNSCSDDSGGEGMSGGTVNLYELAASCLAGSIAASEPIRRIALGALSSPARTPAVTADDNELVNALGTTSLVVVDEEEHDQGKPDSMRSLDSFASGPVTKHAPSRQSSMTSIASRSKSDGTLVTDADGAAQRLIVHAIRVVDARVTIVGEESSEEENRLTSEMDPESDSGPELLSSALCPPAPSGGLLPLHQWESCWLFAQEEIQRRTANGHIGGDLAEVHVDPSRVSVFVDPLDGTKNYARGQFDCVSTLVAIIVDNTPFFGVICKPFGQDETLDDIEISPTNTSEFAESCDLGSPPTSPVPCHHTQNNMATSMPNCCYAVYGGTLLNGVFVAGQEEPISNDLCSRSRSQTDELPRAIISSSRSGGIVKRICNSLYEEGALSPDLVLVSGAGEKALRLIVGTQLEGLWPFPRPGTSLWDVAAADALLIQHGGRLTDAMGRPMNYYAAAFEDGTTDNDSGVFASNNSELHQTCLRVFQKIQEEDSEYGAIS